MYQGFRFFEPGGVSKRNIVFHNKTPHTVWIAYADFDPNCEGQMKFRKHGWRKVSPGKQTRVTMNLFNPGITDFDFGRQAVHNAGYMKQVYLYYAEDDLGHIWSGAHSTHIPQKRFNMCWNMGTTDSRILGMKKKIIDRSDEDYHQGLTLR